MKKILLSLIALVAMAVSASSGFSKIRLYFKVPRIDS